MINPATSKAVVHSAQAWVNAPSSNSDEAAENLPSRQAPPPVSGLVRQEVEIAGTQLEISTTVAGQASKQLAPIAGGSSIEGLGAIIDDRASPEALIGATQLSSGLDGFAASGRVHALSGTTAGPPVLNTAQIAELIPSQPAQSVEIVLQPEELGRIRMTLVSSDGGMVLTVVADRAETLDLLRRNIADLGSELNRLGYDSVDFNFSQSGDDQDLPQNQP
ncbi:MAG: flagellar hook-length control protein FliK, partial [Parasphingorhabdus sp.]|uniref:flagellar hook-length control protein FliK n=1 Tax=Parasphingorhabdus sp. TaxID=2709688 RepID=UPI0032995DEE